MLQRFQRIYWRLASIALLVLSSGCALTSQEENHQVDSPLNYVHAPRFRPADRAASAATAIATSSAAASATGIVQAAYLQPPNETPGDVGGVVKPFSRSLTPNANGEQVIDLASALRRAGAANPVIALAQEAVNASRAEWLQARALMFPTLNAGANYRLHNGAIQNSDGAIRNVNLDSLYFGAGASARGSGTAVVPGVQLVSHLGDAILAPQAARLQLVGRLRDSDAVQQQILLEVALAYLDLVGAHASLEALRLTWGEFDEVARMTANFAKAGQGRDGDAQRARSELHLLDVELDRAREQQAVASANLARLLHLDPSASLVPAQETPPLVEWIDPGIPLESLLAHAIGARPEVAAQAARIAASEVRLRQERVRPWLPTIAVGFSAGEFGGGGGSTPARLDRFQGRTDFDALAVWTLQNMGFGNLALQKRARSQLRQAEADQQSVVDEVRRQVADAFATAQVRRREVELARLRIATGQDAYRQDLARTRNAEGRPLEVLSSINQLAAARIAFVRALVGSSQAQFRLAIAVGRPAAPALSQTGQ